MNDRRRGMVLTLAEAKTKFTELVASVEKEKRATFLNFVNQHVLEQKSEDTNASKANLVDTAEDAPGGDDNEKDRDYSNTGRKRGRSASEDFNARTNDNHSNSINTSANNKRSTTLAKAKKPTTQKKRRDETDSEDDNDDQDFEMDYKHDCHSIPSHSGISARGVLKAKPPVDKKLSHSEGSRTDRQPAKLAAKVETCFEAYGLTTHQLLTSPKSPLLQIDFRDLINGTTWSLLPSASKNALLSYLPKPDKTSEIQIVNLLRHPLFRHNLKIFHDLLAQGKLDDTDNFLNIDINVDVADTQNDRMTIDFGKSTQPLEDRRKSILLQLQQAQAQPRPIEDIYHPPKELLYKLNWILNPMPMTQSYDYSNSETTSAFQFADSESESEEGKSDFVVLLKNTFGRPSSRDPHKEESERGDVDGFNGTYYGMRQASKRGVDNNNSRNPSRATSSEGNQETNKNINY